MARADELIRFGQVAHLSDAELVMLARIGRDVSYPAGRRLITEGQPADRCWLIRDGRVGVDAYVPGRGHVGVQTLSSGDLLGWSWLVPPYRWQFGAYTIDEVAAIEFDALRLTESAETDPVFGRALARWLLEAALARLQATRARLLDLYRNPAERPATGGRTDP